MNSPHPALLRLLGFLALPALVYAQPRYVVTNLGNLGTSSNTIANGINASGTVVGTDGAVFGASKPFIFTTAITELPSLNGLTNEGLGINAAGTIVGTSSTPASSSSHGFIISGGTLTDLGNNTRGIAINDAGTVAGITGQNSFVRSASGAVTLINPISSGGFSTATGINASGTVVGYSDAPGGRRAFTASNGAVTNLGTLSGGSNSYAYGINNAGVAVGQSNESTNRQLHAVIFSGGSVTDIDPSGTNSTATAINSAGSVVGTNSANRAFIYTAATGMVELNTLAVNLAAAGFTSLNEATAINDAGQIVGRGLMTNGRFGAYRLDISTIPAAPTITTGPQSHTVAPGATVVFSVSATSTALSYEWRFNNAPIAGQTASTLTLSSVTAGNAGSYSVRVFNEGGTVTSQAATLTVTSGIASRLINLSILTSLSGGTDAFTMGYVIEGSAAKPLVIRAAGPSLAQFSVSSPLADPKLELYAGQTRSGENNNWSGDPALLNAMNAVGAFAFNGPTSLDAAVAANIPAGSNTVVVSSANNGSGSVIAEIYDATPSASFTASTPRLINVSILKSLGTGFTAGFVIGGSASKTVLVRAIGPTLNTTFGISGVVSDPQLTLFSGQTKIGENNDWGGTAGLTAAFGQVGAFSLAASSKDAALVATLAPGAYTVQVSAASGGSGLVIIEVYALP